MMQPSQRKFIAVVLLLVGRHLDLARACSCFPKVPTLSESYSEAFSVFMGVVTDIEQKGGGTLINEDKIVTFDVDKSWKGAGTESFKVFTGGNGALCGYEFVVGREYLVYTSKGKSFPSPIGNSIYENVNICDRTKTSDKASSDGEIEELDELTKPKPGAVDSPHKYAAVINVDSRYKFRSTPVVKALKRLMRVVKRMPARTLHDGEVVGPGRIIVNGLVIDKGAKVYFEDGTQIFSVGESQLMGRMVPKPVETIYNGYESLPSYEECTLQEGELCRCGGMKRVTGKDGAQSASISFYFLNDATFGHDFFSCNAAPEHLHGESAEIKGEMGMRSAIAHGGKGGDGGDITIWMHHGNELTFQGRVCNQGGGDGGSAKAFGHHGPDCECGGDVEAIGANGGNAGTLTIFAPHINFDAGLQINGGGQGGLAEAHGGNGGSCGVCGKDGGRGGHATASGGKGGMFHPEIISIKAASMSHEPKAVAQSATIGGGGSEFMLPPSSGGESKALGGAGGDAGGTSCPCGTDGGIGGAGGNALSSGGDGFIGLSLVTKIKKKVESRRGFNGGSGSAVNVLSQGGTGGQGGPGGDCVDVDENVKAGKGGTGGTGGNADVTGGHGGLAEREGATGGTGGDVAATCGNGGGGGAGGSCVVNSPAACQAGEAGEGAKKGLTSSAVGKGGTGSLGASDGQDGNDESVPCNDGTEGLLGGMVVQEAPEELCNDPTLSCEDCLDRSCGWYGMPGMCLPKCGILYDTPCYRPRENETSAEVCATAASAKADSDLCMSKSESGCGQCVGTMKSDGDTCMWLEKAQMCMSEFGMMGPGSTECASAPELRVVSFTILSSGSSSGITETITEVYRSEEAFAEMWKNHGRNRFPSPSLPRIDFDKHMVVAVFRGEQTTGGYAVEVTEVAEFSNYTLVTYDVKDQPPGSLSIMALTQPFEIIQIEYSEKPVVFEGPLPMIEVFEIPLPESPPPEIPPESPPIVVEIPPLGPRTDSSLFMDQEDVCGEGMEVFMKNVNGPGCVLCSATGSTCPIRCNAPPKFQCDPADMDNCCQQSPCAHNCPSFGPKPLQCTFSTCTGEPEDCFVTKCPPAPIDLPKPVPFGGLEIIPVPPVPHSVHVLDDAEMQRIFMENKDVCGPGMQTVLTNANGPGCVFCANVNATAECSMFQCLGSPPSRCPPEGSLDQCCQQNPCAQECPVSDANECKVSKCLGSPKCTKTVCWDDPL